MAPAGALFLSGSHTPWRASALVMLMLLAAVTSPAAQAPPSPADGAARAYREGRYDEVQAVLKNATDPRSVALKARAAVARGRYGEAEKLLAPAGGLCAGAATPPWSLDFCSSSSAAGPTHAPH